MPKKKVVSNGEKVNLGEVSFADLFAMYQFASTNWSAGFGVVNKAAEKIISAKVREIETEMYNRLYGCNPYIVKVEGQKPEEVIASLPPVNVNKEEQDKNFAVASNKPTEEVEEPRFIVAKNT